MKRIFITLFTTLFGIAALQASTPAELPRTIFTGPWPAGHVQGIAFDRAAGHMYFSFTTLLVKTDLQGNVLGTVRGLIGHLGCLSFNEEDGRIYGSLEYKNDAIGKGILRREGVAGQVEDAFYIAIFDPKKITRMDMDAEKDGVMTAVYLPTVLDDYRAAAALPEGEREHRYGCSGIDGVSFGPDFGKRSGRRYLVVAYGIYGDNDRSDNDYQVLLQYDTRDWSRYERPLSQSGPHTSGPAKPRNTYFVYTGNTTYGVQNMEWDPETNGWFLAVYPGRKSTFPNYPLFAIDGNARPAKQTLRGIPYTAAGKVLTLRTDGLHDLRSGVSGYDFPDGATGICSLGDGLFYISRNAKTPEGQTSTLTLYRFTGRGEAPFERVE